MRKSLREDGFEFFGEANIVSMTVDSEQKLPGDSFAEFFILRFWLLVNVPYDRESKRSPILSPIFHIPCHYYY
jgi:hypothetical protein